MNPPPTEAPGAAALLGESPCAAAGRPALLRVLADQLDAARRGDLEALAAASRRAGSLLGDAARNGPPLGPEGRARALALHRQAALLVAQQKEEVAQALARLRRGRRTLRAYRRAP
jgi:hypothetical protein